jgi:hypothetical protein
MDASQIIYLILVILSAPLLFIVAFFLNRLYKEKKNNKALFLAKGYFIFGVGDVLLILEQLLLTVQYPNQITISNKGELVEVIARILVCTAIFMVAFGLWYLNKFSLDFLPENFAKLIYIIGPLAFIHAILYFLLPYDWIYRDAIWEFAHEIESWHEPVLIIFYLTPVWLSPLILLFATYKIRTEKKIVVVRSFTITMGLLIGSLGYTIQVVAPSIISGLGFLLMPLITYMGYTMPNWYKKILKIEN